MSDEGFGRNEYIETTHSLVVVTAPGPGSGKMATCLSQLYHEHKHLSLIHILVYEADGSVRFELPWIKKTPQDDTVNDGDSGDDKKQDDLEITVQKPVIKDTYRCV